MHSLRSKFLRQTLKKVLFRFYRSSPLMIFLLYTTLFNITSSKNMSFLCETCLQNEMFGQWLNGRLILNRRTSIHMVLLIEIWDWWELELYVLSQWWYKRQVDLKYRRCSIYRCTPSTSKKSVFHHIERKCTDCAESKFVCFLQWMDGIQIQIKSQMKCKLDFFWHTDGNLVAVKHKVGIVLKSYMGPSSKAKLSENNIK